MKNIPIFIMFTACTWRFILPRGTVPGAVAHPVARHAGAVPARQLARVAGRARALAAVAGVLIAFEHGLQRCGYHALATVHDSFNRNTFNYLFLFLINMFFFYET